MLTPTGGRAFDEVFTTSPADDLMHPPGDTPTFNESMYFNLVDADTGVAAWLRLGNRPNEGHAEVTVCIYLPDGSVAFHHTRPAITGNQSFDAGGLRVEVVEPLVRLRITYAGPTTVLADPLSLRNPREAFRTAPSDCSVTLECTAVAPVYGGVPQPGAVDPVEGFATATTLQLVGWAGSITVGGSRFDVDGARGLRDHSWGPRTWQAPDHYRWLTGNFGDDGFMALVFAPGSETARRTGFVVQDGVARVLDDVEVSFTERDGVPVDVEATLVWGDERLRLTGAVGAVVPLRHRRGAETTTINEGLTAWAAADGRTGHGFIEFLDRQPTGA